MTLPAPEGGLAGRLAVLEQRLRRLEDHQSIYQLLASYGPAADGLSRDDLAALWAPDGRYETEHHTFLGANEVGGIVDDPMHREFIAAGCAHVMSLPQIYLAGDNAVAISYSRVYVAADQGWRVARVAANRWELTRDAAGAWRVTRRVNRLLAGGAAARALLAGAAEPISSED